MESAVDMAGRVSSGIVPPTLWSDGTAGGGNKAWGDICLGAEKLNFMNVNAMIVDDLAVIGNERLLAIFLLH